MEVLPGLFEVEGVDPPGFTTHVYLLRDSGPTYTLVDTGMPGSEVAISAYLARLGIAPTAVRRILITHLHADHTGALAAVAALTKGRTFAHWIESGYLSGEVHYGGPGAVPKEPIRIDEPIHDAERIDGGGGLIAYHTPGHTPGHTVYYQPERKLLFPGDLLSAHEGQLQLGPAAYSIDPPTMRLSARRVSQLSVEAILTYHGGPILDGASAAMRAFAASL
ncbi:MAG: MBL fold metallo-hydrolase [Thermoplasmata archaeon]